MSWLHPTAAAAAPQPVVGPTAPPPRTFTPEMEHHARVAGFRNAEQMLLWSQQRNQHTGGTVDGDKQPSIHAAMAWHPANIFNYISEAMKNATGN